jgi:serine/threonine protein kinase
MASWRPSARLTPVERFDRFEILGRIGRGGMAEILLARERSLTGGSRHLVIKRVLPEVQDVDDMLHMFLDETRVVMGLSHPNLCQIYEVGEQDGCWFIAMEWVNGVTLHQLLRRAREIGDLDYGVLARIVSQCAEALHYAHTARDAEGQLISLVHRDVSPHNLMIAYDGRVKLLDFGIAKSTATTHHTEAGVVKGKVCYMAPEQWLSHPLDGRTDVFALGACLYEALTGRVLFKRDNQLDVMKAAVSGDVPPLSSLAPGVPAALAQVAHRALQPKPEARYQTAREMSEALERFVSGLGEAVSAARVSDYARRLFREELQLGPVLERSLRGAQLARTDGLFLPPLPASLRGAVRSEASARPLPPPPFALGRASSERTGPARPWPAEGAFDLEPASVHGPTALPGAMRAPRRSHPSAHDRSLLPSSLHARGPASAAREPEAARDGAHTTGRAARQMDGARLVGDTPDTPSQMPTRPKVPSLRGLLAVSAEIARPLARTHSLRAVRGARRALLAAAVALGAALPMYFAARALLGHDAPPSLAVQSLVAQPAGEGMPGPMRAEQGALLRGAFAAPAFTLVPPSVPLAGAPVAARALAPLAEPGDAARDQQAGRLSINTRPWSTVYLGKRLLGTTPLADIAVPRGALNLRLVDRDGKVHIRRLPASKRRSRSVSYAF